MAMLFRSTRQRFAFARLSRWLLLCAALSLCGCEATLFAGINTTDQNKDITERRGIVFDADHHLALDVYKPTHAEHAPVVVFFYGGDWARGKREWYRFVGTALAARGVMVVIPDYRKVPHVALSGFMQDAANAVAWVHTHANELGGNKDDVFLMGHSAGGQIAALLATDGSWLGAHGMHPNDLAGFIGLAGCYDFVPVPEDDQDMIGAFGATPDQQRKGEPVSFVHGAEPPMLLMQGIDDHEVEPSNAISLDRAMVAQHEEVTLKLYPGLGHEILLFALTRPMHDDAPMLGDILDFIETHPASQPIAQSSAASR